MSSQTTIFDLGTGEPRAPAPPEPTPDETPEPEARTGTEAPEGQTAGEDLPANPDPTPQDTPHGAARPRMDWQSLEVTDADLWLALTRREHPTETDSRGDAMATHLLDDITALAGAGALRLHGLPVEVREEPTTLRDVKRSALACLGDVRPDVSESAARAYRATVQAAKRPATVRVAGRQLQKMVAAVRNER